MLLCWCPGRPLCRGRTDCTIGHVLAACAYRHSKKYSGKHQMNANSQKFYEYCKGNADHRFLAWFEVFLVRSYMRCFLQARVSCCFICAWRVHTTVHCKDNAVEIYTSTSAAASGWNNALDLNKPIPVSTIYVCFAYCWDTKSRTCHN